MARPSLATATEIFAEPTANSSCADRAGVPEFPRRCRNEVCRDRVPGTHGYWPAALAHHSGAAEFDSNKKIDLTGVVTKVEWTNPHAHFYVDVKDSNGNVINWNLELASPNVLIRNGWHRNSIKPGDMVSVTGIRAKDRPDFGSASVITFPDGHRLTFLGAEDPAK